LERVSWVLRAIIASTSWCLGGSARVPPSQDRRLEALRSDVAFSCLVFLAGCASCKREAAALAATDDLANNVLLTDEQVRSTKIVTAPVELQDVDDAVLASGRVTYDDQKIIHVFSPVSGKATKVFVQLGDHVKKGDPLVSIESPDIGSATSDVSKARADLIAAEHDYARTKELYESHAASQKDLETAADNYRKTKAELERAQQKAWLFQRGDVVGQTYTLRSDLDGEVFLKTVTPGMEIAGQYGGSAVEIFTVGDADKVWVLADVFELDIARVKLDAKANVTLTSWPARNFEGRVDWISGSLDRDTHATKVRVAFDNADRALKPEMFATMRIAVDVRRGLAIPRAAIVHLGDQTVVFFDRGMSSGKRRFERMPVVVDEVEAGKWVPVAHGIEVGDVIVTDGAVLLSGIVEK
jgi:cobalt-zinc-cadmium efflux system membrane fusion protein